MVLKGKIILETSTIIKQDIPYIPGPKREGIPFSGMIKRKFQKVYRIKSIKIIKNSFSLLF